ncbi:hypothetical protein Hanom_Chr06g00548731 [Helianthus anomalus]
MPCRSLGILGACTGRSWSLWAMDPECLLNFYDITHLILMFGFLHLCFRYT